jgi:hypothetical protein
MLCVIWYIKLWGWYKTVLQCLQLCTMMPRLIACEMKLKYAICLSPRLLMFKSLSLGTLQLSSSVIPTFFLQAYWYYQHWMKPYWHYLCCFYHICYDFCDWKQNMHEYDTFCVIDSIPSSYTAPAVCLSYTKLCLVCYWKGSHFLLWQLPELCVYVGVCGWVVNFLSKLTGMITCPQPVFLYIYGMQVPVTPWFTVISEPWISICTGRQMLFSKCTFMFSVSIGNRGVLVPTLSQLPVYFDNSHATVKISIVECFM